MAKKQTEATTTVAIIPVEFTAPVKFSIPDKDKALAIIAEKKTEYSALVISGVEDKKGYKAVNAAMSEMKSSRIAFTKAATENITDPVKEWLKEASDDVKEIALQMKEVEDLLREKKDLIDAEKERIAEEKRQEKQRKIQQRIGELFSLGADLSTNSYIFPFDNSLSIGVLQVEEFDDDEFHDFIEEVKLAYTTEQDRLSAVKLQEEENQRQQAELLEQAQQLATVNQERALKLRKKELLLMGFELDGTKYIHATGDVKIAENSVKSYTDDQWDKFIEDAERDIEAGSIEVEEVPVAVQPVPSPVSYHTGPSSFMPEQDDEVLVDEQEEIAPVNFEIETDHIELQFDSQTVPYMDFNISPTFFIRLHPDSFAEIAMNGIKAERIANTGIVGDNNLSWALIKA